MNGPRKNYKKYNEYIKLMDAPVMPSELPKRKINLSAIAQYALENEIVIAELSEEEKEKLIKKFEKE